MIRKVDFRHKLIGGPTVRIVAKVDCGEPDADNEIDRGSPIVTGVMVVEDLMGHNLTPFLNGDTLRTLAVAAQSEGMTP